MIIRCYTGLNGGKSMLIKAENMAEDTLISDMGRLGSRGRGTPGAEMPLCYREINHITEAVYPEIAGRVPQAPATFQEYLERVAEHDAHQNIEDVSDELANSAAPNPNNRI